jgi:hypothetical protein
MISVVLINNLLKCKPSTLLLATIVNLPNSFYPHHRWYHLYHCYQTKISLLGNDKFTDFCFECDQWFVNKLEWDQHCQEHLDTPDTLLRCEPIVFRNTLVRAGFSPFCLGKNDCASRRLQQFIEKWKWHKHIESHLKDLTDFTFTISLHWYARTEHNTLRIH